MQRTLLHATAFAGRGLHSGAPAKMVVRPASVEHGIWFRRTDVLDRDPLIPAQWHAARHTPLCTTLENLDGVTVSTVEHIMAALSGCGVHNALIEIDGPEVPILDGSASEFVKEILKTGLVSQAMPIQAIEILKPIRAEHGEAWATFEPAPSLEIDFEIEFADAAIGHQHKTLNMANGAFVRELCDSRTFCRQSDVDAMRAQGLALGGTLENAVVVDGADVLSPGGLRWQDEAVRHKMLDAMGDLALAGKPILGRYRGMRAGHTLTNKLLRALFSDPTAFKLVTLAPSMEAKLPGVGVHLGDLPQAC